MNSIDAIAQKLRENKRLNEDTKKMDIYIGDNFDVVDSQGREYNTTIENIFVTDVYLDKPEIFIKHSWVSKEDGRKGNSTHALSVFKTLIK